MIDVEQLSRVALFNGLDADRLARIGTISEVIHLAENEILSHEGAEANSFYILLEGQVRISKKLRLLTLEDLEGEDRILTTVTSETLPALGETALLGGAQRVASMRCVTACRLLRIHAFTLRTLMEEDHTIARCVYGNLCEILYWRLESANNDIVKLSAALVYALET